mmetsp:Transcript_11961/g.50327  ORF Transcript_11961/g.50327 Transcript_11961/m.50327 type:complete len:221 (-) Transcript_11961:626-1288(-)
MHTPSRAPREPRACPSDLWCCTRTFARSGARRGSSSCAVRLRLPRSAHRRPAVRGVGAARARSPTRMAATARRAGWCAPPAFATPAQPRRGPQAFPPCPRHGRLPRPPRWQRLGNSRSCTPCTASRCAPSLASLFVSRARQSPGATARSCRCSCGSRSRALSCAGSGSSVAWRVPTPGPPCAPSSRSSATERVRRGPGRRTVSSHVVKYVKCRTITQERY